MNNLKYGDNLHKEYPKTCAPDDFWRQVCRTVNGEPVGEEQIEMIITQIEKKLDLTVTDKLLDLGCGNGALSSLLFYKIKSYLGIDFSDYLVKIARNNFESKDFVFHIDNVVGFLDRYKNPYSFNKVLSYGAFSYFNDADAEIILKNLNKKYVNVIKIFLGNLPDRDRADSFYQSTELKRTYIDDPKSSIGVWRTKEQLEALVRKCGWKAEFCLMPTPFYASYYRYDVLLSR